MSKDLRPARTELLVVSDTRFYRRDKQLIAFEAPLREVEMLTEIFDRVRWLGTLRHDQNPKDARAPLTEKVELIPMPFAGGPRILDKIAVAKNLITYYRVISRYLQNTTYVHTRAPAPPAFISILQSLTDRKRKYWHKYAGNWKEDDLALSYRVQRALMKKATNTFVTINGKWPGQEPHVHTFENPCFSNSELEEAKLVKDNKSYSEALNLCFVGRVDEAKGVDKLLEALRLMEYKFNEVTIVGGGDKKDYFEQLASEVNQNIQFTGKVSRVELNKIYSESHLFCLPSKGEGFPKVVAESASYGCIPVVSSVSSISQYIVDNYNGYTIQDVNSSSLAEKLDYACKNRKELETFSKRLDELLIRFTYEAYNNRIRKEFIGDFKFRS